MFFFAGLRQKFFFVICGTTPKHLPPPLRRVSIFHSGLPLHRRRRYLQEDHVRRRGGDDGGQVGRRGPRKRRGDTGRRLLLLMRGFLARLLGCFVLSRRCRSSAMMCPTFQRHVSCAPPATCHGALSCVSFFPQSRSLISVKMGCRVVSLMVLKCRTHHRGAKFTTATARIRGTQHTSRVFVRKGGMR